MRGTKVKQLRHAIPFAPKNVFRQMKRRLAALSHTDPAHEYLRERYEDARSTIRS